MLSPPKVKVILMVALEDQRFLQCIKVIILCLSNFEASKASISTNYFELYHSSSSSSNHCITPLATFPTQTYILYTTLPHTSFSYQYNFRNTTVQNNGIKDREQLLCKYKSSLEVENNRLSYTNPNILKCILLCPITTDSLYCTFKTA